MRIKQLLVISIVIICYFLRPTAVNATDYQSDYQVTYNVSQNQGQLTTHVNFNIKITNLRSDIYVSKFAISFPKNFIIHNLTATDDNGPIAPNVSVTNDNTNIDLEFSKPATGRDSINNFNLSFDQDNLFKANGNIWEVILPTIENKGDSIYKVVVILPPINTKKLSIAKPVPDTVEPLPDGTRITWYNAQTKTIYAVFGNNQMYESNLVYHISNPKLLPVYTDIAIPPDTLYQKIFLKSMSVLPNEILRDADGNLLGRYYLNPRESKTISVDMFIETMNIPRDEVKSFIQTNIGARQKYLLSPQPYWQIDDNHLSQISSLKNPADIYSFVTNSLHYNYKKVNLPNNRLGADMVLTHPDQAVCVEFTDLFIAISREKGIMSREMEGYGFTQDTQLRPLSLSSDILHSWPEYYDQNSKLWIPVDPTWENTSGIDYFSSFDFNHIVFAIHGQRDDYPLPAGMYKFDNSHDITIQPTTVVPDEKQILVLQNISMPKNLNDNQTYHNNLIIRNEGNVYAWNIPVAITAKNLNLAVGKTIVQVLAPGEQTTIPLSYNSSVRNQQANAEMDVRIGNNINVSYLSVIVPYYYNLSIKIAILVFILAAGIICWKLFKLRKK